MNQAQKKSGSAAGGTARGAAPGGGRPPSRSKSGVYWILGGLVVTGIIAGYNWLRSLHRY